MRIDYRTYRNDKLIWALLGVVALLLVAVLFRRPINGTRRWFGIGGFGIQPSELAKLAAIFFTALVLERRRHRINELGYALLPIGVIVGGLTGLILLEPDFGTAVSLLAVVGVMIFAAGFSYRYLLGAAAAGAARALRDPDAGRLPAAPAADLHGSVGRSARRRLPDHPVAHRRRHRRRVRQGPDERRAEAVLPARAAHRFHLRGDLGRDRADRRDPGAAVLLRDRMARHARGAQGARQLRRLPRAWASR